VRKALGIASLSVRPGLVQIFPSAAPLRLCKLHSACVSACTFSDLFSFERQRIGGTGTLLDHYHIF